jgi:hypothetical protein
MMHSRPPAWIVGLWFVNITIWTRTIGEGGTMSANKHFQVSNEETRHPGPGAGASSAADSDGTTAGSGQPQSLTAGRP